MADMRSRERWARGASLCRYEARAQIQQEVNKHSFSLKAAARNVCKWLPVALKKAMRLVSGQRVVKSDFARRECMFIVADPSSATSRNITVESFGVPDLSSSAVNSCVCVCEGVFVDGADV